MDRIEESQPPYNLVRTFQGTQTGENIWKTATILNANVASPQKQCTAFVSRMHNRRSPRLQ